MDNIRDEMYTAIKYSKNGLTSEQLQQQFDISKTEVADIARELRYTRDVKFDWNTSRFRIQESD